MSKNNQEKIGSRKLVISQDLCIACGLCVSICSQVFESDPDNDYKSKVKGECNDESKCQEAIDSRPVGAISWS